MIEEIVRMAIDVVIEKFLFFIVVFAIWRTVVISVSSQLVCLLVVGLACFVLQDYVQQNVIQTKFVSTGLEGFFPHGQRISFRRELTSKAQLNTPSTQSLTSGSRSVFMSSSMSISLIRWRVSGSPFLWSAHTNSCGCC